MHKVCCIFICLALLACSRNETITEMCKPVNHVSNQDENEVKNFAAKGTDVALNATPDSPPSNYYTKQGWQHFNEAYVQGRLTSANYVISYNGAIVITQQCLVNNQPGWLVTLPARIETDAFVQYLNVKQLIVKINNEFKIVRTELSPKTGS